MALTLRFCFPETAKKTGALLALFWVAHTAKAGTSSSSSNSNSSSSIIISSSSQNTVFDYRLASSMPVINTNVTAAVMADRQDMSGIRCSMLCSANVGCIAFYYSQSLKRCRLLRDVIRPETEDDSLYIVISGGASPINIALYKPASASSEYTNRCCPASLAVDGNTKTMLHTNCTEPYPWLMVDLQYVYLVTEVTVYTYCGCCFSRMHDIDVRVGDTALGGGNGLFGGSLCYHRTGSFTSCLPGETYECAEGTIGRYLTLQVTTATDDANQCFTPSEIVVKGELLGV